MSNLSPFLQEVAENLKTNGASEEEVNVVTSTLEADVDMQKQICSEREGFVWNSETNTCEKKVEIEEVVVDEVDDITETDVVEEEVEEVQTGEEIKEEKIEEGFEDKTETVPERVLNQAVANNKKQYNEMAAGYDKKEVFWMQPNDFGWKDDQKNYTEEGVVDMMLDRKSVV